MRIVQKFGGTSVADISKIKSVAEKIQQQYDLGVEIIVVVSAMAGVTNQLVRYLTEISGTISETSDQDTVLASGEQVSAGLLALALQRLNVPSQSMLAWQIPIITDNQHTNATITDISTKTIDTLLSQRVIPIIAGFQGLSSLGRITTLGRGGSDTTAVALAAFCGAERCDIYTDVEGIYTADPHFVPNAIKLDEISYDHMLTLAQNGAKVLQEHSVAFAHKYKVPVRVLSSFTNSSGTLMSEAPIMSRSITSIAHKVDMCSITLAHDFSVMTIPMSEKEKSLQNLKEKPLKVIDNTGIITIVGQLIQQENICSMLESIGIISIRQSNDAHSITFLMHQHQVGPALHRLHEELILRV